ncbi:hypothetical protein ACI5KX_05075 [Erythrobacter sp. GH1-10]|uniref:hypothetical protein n=1 Tax=Erythrobacter sp. GH1-10 TaxID=3349334 RepID=UPI0038781E9A
MTKPFKSAAIAAIAFLASACSATSEQTLAIALSPPEPKASIALCQSEERQLFLGQSTTDEFGYAIAVCVLKGEGQNDDRVSVVLAGEGGNLRTSCLASACEGVIEYSRYTRYRFTELRLKWSTDSGEHQLVEGFDAQDMGAETDTAVLHYWPGSDDAEQLASGYAPLALMELGKSLPDN